MHPLKEVRKRLLNDALALIPKDATKMTPEIKCRAERMLADADVMQHQIEADEIRSTGRPPRSQPGAGIEAKPENAAERRAFTAYLKDGIVDRNVLKEQRDLNTGGAAGVLIAQDFLPQLVEAKKAWGQLTTAVGQKKTQNGEPLRIPGVDDTAQMSTVIGESTTASPKIVSEVDPNFAGTVSNVDFLTTGEIKISLAELQDSYFDLDAWIRDAFGKRIARGLAGLIVTGSTTGNFQSIITTAGKSVASTNTSVVTYDDFVAMYAALDPAYLATASWVMNSTTRSLILGEKDTLGRPLFVPSVNTDNLDRILGLPVVISQAHPSVAAGAVGAVQLGSLTDAYTLRTAGEVSILRLNERYADQGQVAFIGYHRNGGWANPVGSPIVNLKQAAS